MTPRIRLAIAGTAVVVGYNGGPMASELPDVVVRVAGSGDAGTVASLRSLWSAAEDPDSWWGQVGNMFVREEHRSRGVGSLLLMSIVAADEQGYARLVLSPSARALPFYRRAGFIVPDDAAAGESPARASRSAGMSRRDRSRRAELDGQQYSSLRRAHARRRRSDR